MEFQWVEVAVAHSATNWSMGDLGEYLTARFCLSKNAVEGLMMQNNGKTGNDFGKLRNIG